jgi:RNA polymerase sigma-70 factor (ECF subfamily)
MPALPILMNERPQAIAASDTSAVASRADTSTERVRHVVDRYYDFVWRVLRFLGVPDAHVEDSAQLVFCVLARKIGDVAPGAESTFLFSTASRVASEARRAARRRPVASDADVDLLAMPLPSPDELLDQRRARQTLDEVLAAMPVDLRAVFVLFEIEELTIPEIAAAVGVRAGTAASRLRRAREEFQAILRRRFAARGHVGHGGRP